MQTKEQSGLQPASNHPLVSILIPVYNREQHIGACIQSALDQTYENLEVVVLDNASTDYTWAICEAFAAKDSRVRVFRNAENLGPVRNWRRCLEEARGELGKILFSDDLLYPDYLTKTVPLLSEDVAFVFSTTEIGPGPGRGTLYYQPFSESGVYSTKAYIDSAVRMTADVPVSPGAALFRLGDLRQSLVETLPSRTIEDFARHGAGPDLLIYLLTAARYPSFAYLAETECFFRAHEGSFTISDGGRYLPLCYQAAIDWFNFLTAGMTDEGEETVQQGEAMFEAGLFEEALRVFKAYLRREVRSPDAFNNVGAVLWAQEQYDEALTYFRTAYQLAPENQTYAGNLADAYTALGMAEKAEAMR